MIFSGLPFLAVIVNESRAKDSAKSFDIYARNWIPPNLQQEVSLLWNEYSDKVYCYDDIVLSVRNRYFLNMFNKHIEENTDCILMPCGLVSYPMTVNKNAKFIEIDFPELVEYKSKIINLNEEKNIFRKCNRTFIGFDICNKSKRKIFLTQLDPERKKIFLLEGLSYYLTYNDWWSIIYDIIRVTKKGDVIAFDFWLINEKNKNIYRKLKAFCNNYLKNRIEKFMFLDAEDILGKMPQSNIEIISVKEAEVSILKSSYLKKKCILNDTYVTMLRT